MRKPRFKNPHSQRRRGLRAAIWAVAGAAVIAACAVVVTGVASSAPPDASSPTCPAGSTLQLSSNGGDAQCVITATGTPVGAVKHVWLIILENKSYDETFTGLNQNSYLWQTLPQQGALLTNYYGTGHFSMDNYISLVSGQAPSYAVQDDCATAANMTNSNAGIITTGTVGTGTDTDLTTDAAGKNTKAPTTSGAGNGNYGQLLVHGGVNAPLVGNGCVYPTNVPTLFNQLNAAGVSWKAYAQDLGGAQPTGAASYMTEPTVPNREDGLCGYPGSSSNDPVTNPTSLTSPTGNVASFTGAQQAANGLPADQYVAKHFPPPWFTSLTGESSGTQSGVSYTASPPLNVPTTPEPDSQAGTETNCDANHIANLDDPTYGLAHDLTLPADQVPAFSWITPNNCSDAHDASCQGNNLSGAFNADGTPNYSPAGHPADDPEATTPTNFTGGLYASDLFLRYYIPLIEQSAAFKDGGMIDITFDEANPPFTVGNSFNNAPAPGDATTYSAPADAPTFGPGGEFPGAQSLYGAYGALADAAGENINGHNVSTEPTGPNDPEVTDSSGNQLQPGPGAAGFIDRPSGLANESPNVSGSPNSTSEPAMVAPGSSLVTDSKINADDTGRLVSGTDGTNTIPADTFVGTVSDTGPYSLSGNTSASGASNNFAKPWIGTFQLVNDSGQPVTLPNGYNGNVTLSGEAGSSTISGASCQSNFTATNSNCRTTDPLFDATDFTPGGGDTGTVLISPLINPGTVTGTYYNHYSTLRTLEDLLLTGKSCTDTALVAGSVCGGLDGQGHLGYAAQAGLGDFGPDVFSAESFTQAPVPAGYQPVSTPSGPPHGPPGPSPNPGPDTLYCPNGANLGNDGHAGDTGHGAHPGTGGTGGTAGCGANGGDGGNSGDGTTAAGTGGNGGNGGNAPCAPEKWAGVWLSAAGSNTVPYDTPPCDGHGGDAGSGGSGGNGKGTVAGGNGGNGGDGFPGHHGGNGGNGGNAGPHGAGAPGTDGTDATATQNGQNGQNGANG